MVNASHYINEIYVINKESNLDRWKTISGKMESEKTDIPYNQFIGLDADKLNLKDYSSEISSQSSTFLMTKHIYAKSKSHYNLWKYLLDNEDKKEDKDTKNDKNGEVEKDEKDKNDKKDKNKKSESESESENDTNHWTLVVEDDSIIPDNFNVYLKQLTQFLNLLPSEQLDQTDLLNISAYGNYTNQYTGINNIILTFMLSILTMVFKKKNSTNTSSFTSDIDGKKWDFVNSFFPLGTHAYLVNLKQCRTLVNYFDTNKFSYHLDVQLNLNSFNINTITPFGIRRGGISDGTTPTLTTPALPVKILTMFNPELAHDLGKPIVNILGVYQLNILIVAYGIFLIIWQIIDIPGRLQEYFENI